MAKKFSCEDNELNMEISLALLKDKNIEVVTAYNGQQGVELFTQSSPGEFNAILMDIRMPIMDGRKATVAIRALDRPDAKDIPIIAMTADAYDDDMKECLAVGMNAHVAKPIDPTSLYKTLAEVFSTSDK